MLQILTAAVMRRKHPHGVREAGNASNWFHLFNTLFPKKRLKQIYSTSFQGVQFMNHTEIFVINAITVKNNFYCSFLCSVWQLRSLVRLVRHAGHAYFRMGLTVDM